MSPGNCPLSSVVYPTCSDPFSRRPPHSRPQITSAAAATDARCCKGHRGETRYEEVPGNPWLQVREGERGRRGRDGRIHGARVFSRRTRSRSHPRPRASLSAPTPSAQTRTDDTTVTPPSLAPRPRCAMATNTATGDDMTSALAVHSSCGAANTWAAGAGEKSEGGGGTLW
jgi:hypothetical protein